jgi:hypothetical protein
MGIDYGSFQLGLAVGITISLLSISFFSTLYWLRENKKK